MNEDYCSTENDFDRILYQYYKANGGCFMGNPYDGKYPHCQLILDVDTAPLSVHSVIHSQSQYGYGLTCAAVTQAELTRPYHLEIIPSTIFRKGMELLAKQDIKVRYRDLDQRYLIKSDNPAFTKILLPGSNLADLLLQTKVFCIRVEPVAREKHLHAVQVIRERRLDVEVQGKTISKEELPIMIELCRAAAYAVKSYAMPEETAGTEM